jgi:hypothetical protein
MLMRRRTRKAIGEVQGLVDDARTALYGLVEPDGEVYAQTTDELYPGIRDHLTPRLLRHLEGEVLSPLFEAQAVLESFQR